MDVHGVSHENLSDWRCFPPPLGCCKPLQTGQWSQSQMGSCLADAAVCFPAGFLTAAFPFTNPWNLSFWWARLHPKIHIGFTKNQTMDNPPIWDTRWTTPSAEWDVGENGVLRPDLAITAKIKRFILKPVLHSKTKWNWWLLITAGFMKHPGTLPKKSSEDGTWYVGWCFFLPLVQ